MYQLLFCFHLFQLTQVFLVLYANMTIFCYVYWRSYWVGFCCRTTQTDCVTVAISLYLECAIFPSSSLDVFLKRYALYKSTFYLLTYLRCCYSCYTGPVMVFDNLIGRCMSVFKHAAVKDVLCGLQQLAEITDKHWLSSCFD